jgi:hypothetical protein
MPTSAAERTRACRARLRAGKARLTVEVSIFELSDLLVDLEYLQSWDADNRKAIAGAVEKLLAGLVVARIEQ